MINTYVYIHIYIKSYFSIIDNTALEKCIKPIYRHLNIIVDFIILSQIP